MAKIKGKLFKGNRIGSLTYLKRTIPGSRTQGVHCGARKKSGGDDFTDNVRSVRLKSKKRKKK